MYTNKEYAALVEQAPAYDLINNINFILVKGYRLANPERISIEEYIVSNHPKISKLFFDIPLRSIPLFINHENDLIKAIALWRLKIAK